MAKTVRASTKCYRISFWCPFKGTYSTFIFRSIDDSHFCHCNSILWAEIHHPNAAPDHPNAAALTFHPIFQQCKIIDPLRLSGLKQAAYVLDCLQNGLDENEIASKFEGDRQLVKMWISFLRHNHWMERPDGKWTATAKGREWTNNKFYNGRNWRL